MLPDLATGWTISDDGRTYTFQLATDARWEDGEAVTAADVAFTIGLLQDPKYDGPHGSSWQGIHATAVGASTVQFTMLLPIADSCGRLPCRSCRNTCWRESPRQGSPIPVTAPGPSATDRTGWWP